MYSELTDLLEKVLKEASSDTANSDSINSKLDTASDYIAMYTGDIPTDDVLFIKAQLLKIEGLLSSKDLDLTMINRAKETLDNFH